MQPSRPRSGSPFARMALRERVAQWENMSSTAPRTPIAISTPEGAGAVAKIDLSSSPASDKGEQPVLPEHPSALVPGGGAKYSFFPSSKPSLERAPTAPAAVLRASMLPHSAPKYTRSISAKGSMKPPARRSTDPPGRQASPHTRSESVLDPQLDAALTAQTTMSIISRRRNAKSRHIKVSSKPKVNVLMEKRYSGEKRYPGDKRHSGEKRHSGGKSQRSPRSKARRSGASIQAWLPKQDLQLDLAAFPAVPGTKLNRNSLAKDSLKLKRMTQLKREMQDYSKRELPQTPVSAIPTPVELYTPKALEAKRQRTALASISTNARVAPVEGFPLSPMAMNTAAAVMRTGRLSTSSHGSAGSRVSTKTTTAIKLRSGSVVTFISPEQNAWQRTVYQPGEIKVSKSPTETEGERTSVASMDAFRDAVEDIEMTDHGPVAIDRKNSDDATMEDIVDFFEEMDISRPSSMEIDKLDRFWEDPINTTVMEKRALPPLPQNQPPATPSPSWPIPILPGSILPPSGINTPQGIETRKSKHRPSNSNGSMGSTGSGALPSPRTLPGVKPAVPLRQPPPTPQKIGFMRLMKSAGSIV